MWKSRIGVVVAVGAIGLGLGVIADGAAVPADGAAAARMAEACQARTRDGLNVYFSSESAGGVGGLDIWVSQRSSRTEAFARPVVLAAPVNSRADDYCPTPMARGWVMFLSTRPSRCRTPGLYVTRKADRGWQKATRIGCLPVGYR